MSILDQIPGAKKEIEQAREKKKQRNSVVVAIVVVIVLLLLVRILNAPTSTESTGDSKNATATSEPILVSDEVFDELEAEYYEDLYDDIGAEHDAASQYRPY